MGAERALRTLLLVGALLVVPSTVASQVVTEVPLSGSIGIPDGIAVGPDGRVYVADYGGGFGTRVMRVERDGRVTEFARGFRAPDGLAFDRSGDLFVSSFAGGTIHRVSPDGTVALFSSGLDHPSALAFDAKGRLFVSEFGEFNGTQVSRIDSAGRAEVYARGFRAPLGLAFGPDSLLYVSNFGSGEIHRISAGGVVERFAQIANAPLAQLQYLAFDRAGTLFVASLGHHRIYAIDRAGSVRTHAGSGIAGTRDGRSTDARLHAPNSVAMRGDTLLFTEYASGRLRMVHTGAAKAAAPDAEVRLDGRHLADDSATFVVRQALGGAAPESLGVLHVTRRRVGNELHIVQRWDAGGLRAVDTTRVDRRTLRAIARMSGPVDRRTTVRFDAEGLVSRTMANGATADSLSVPYALSGVFDATIVEQALAAFGRGAHASAYSFFVPAQRGVVRMTARVDFVLGAGTDVRQVSLAYPSAKVAALVEMRGRRVRELSFDFGGRVLRLTRQ